MFCLDVTKSAEPNGYGAGFKKDQNMISQNIKVVVLKVLNNGNLFMQLKATMIALIPKMDNHVSTSQ